ncbi:hypothetical protein Vafri_15508 [Volvox africanus]|uniref:Uncharacterized protein n=1 Tax=Volvox africanus TaxID=51714 RepID=A0A8J4BFN4_9CHLO|nr:hypothetical protein Vafri_15508 [Volvox africanus]
MSFLLRSCFHGQSGRTREVTSYKQGTCSEAGACAKASDGFHLENLTADVKSQGLSAPRTGCNGVYVHIHAPAGGHGLSTFDPRTPTISIPSFTLCAIAEDEADEDGDDGDDGVSPSPYVSGGHPAMATAAATRGSASAALAAGPGGCNATMVGFDQLSLEPCAFAIIPTAPLSTVFEEDANEEGVAASGSCHSADAGCGQHGGLPTATLVRGLSAPACASSSVPSGGSSGGCALPALPALPAWDTAWLSPALPMKRQQAISPRCTAGTSTELMRPIYKDPGAVWYF